MTKIASRFTLAAAAVLLSAQASAQGMPFDAEIDCGGFPSPGDVVPFVLDFQNQTFNAIPLNVTVDIQVPGLGTFRIRDRNITHGPNQDLTFQQMIQLPGFAPNRDYTMVITASSARATAMDTCSFNVI